MEQRQPLAPDNSREPLSKLLFNGVLEAEGHPYDPEDVPTILTYTSPGRQNSEGFGGGRVVSRRNAA